MVKNSFLPHFQQYLSQLRNEIEAYPDDASIWHISEGISNSGGSLCYHLCGNLNHFIGKGMGDTGYERDRELEFSIRNVSREQLIDLIEATVEMLEKTLPGVDPEAGFPASYWGQPMSVGDALLKLLAHLGYHVGQVNYHRRLLQNASVTSRS